MYLSLWIMYQYHFRPSHSITIYFSVRIRRTVTTLKLLSQDATLTSQGMLGWIESSPGWGMRYCVGEYQMGSVVIDSIVIHWPLPDVSVKCVIVSRPVANILSKSNEIEQILTDLNRDSQYQCIAWANIDPMASLIEWVNNRHVNINSLHQTKWTCTNYISKPGST